MQIIDFKYAAWNLTRHIKESPNKMNLRLLFSCMFDLGLLEVIGHVAGTADYIMKASPRER